MKTLKRNALPQEMAYVKTVVDPFNHKSYYIFGTGNSNRCWYFNHETQLFNEISDIPKRQTQGPVCGNACAMFQTINDGNKYALIYGGSELSSTYNIFDFQKQKWNEIAIKLNKLWFNCSRIITDGSAKYGFGVGLSMITDLFTKNKIHIVRGDQSEDKYGCFEFNEQILNNSDLSFALLLFLCVLS